MSTHLSHQAREKRIAELATTPVTTARSHIRMEDALRRIEALADLKIHEYGITQETPEKWMQLGDLVRNLLAPIRDAAREGLKS